MNIPKEVAMRFNGRTRFLLFSGLLLGILVVAGCTDTRRTTRAVAGGDPQLGREALHHYGCISCHAIPGERTVGGLNSHVGPPLDSFSTRRFIAGSLANTDANLISWLVNPQAIRPGSAMPDLGVSDADARHITAFLYSLDAK
jgi:cytochrome c2